MGTQFNANARRGFDRLVTSSIRQSQPTFAEIEDASLR